MNHKHDWVYARHGRRLYSPDCGESADESDVRAEREDEARRAAPEQADPNTPAAVGDSPSAADPSEPQIPADLARKLRTLIAERFVSWLPDLNGTLHAFPADIRYVGPPRPQGPLCGAPLIAPQAFVITSGAPGAPACDSCEHIVNEPIVALLKGVARGAYDTGIKDMRRRLLAELATLRDRSGQFATPIRDVVLVFLGAMQEHVSGHSGCC